MFADNRHGEGRGAEAMGIGRRDPAGERFPENTA